MTRAFFPAALFLLILLPFCDRAQSDDPVIRVSVNLVQVDAVVTDSQGRHVEGLKPEDFEIFENGRRQPITAFSEVKAKPSARRPTEAIFTPTKPLRPEDVRRTIVLIADNFSMEFRNTAFVRKAMKAFVDEQMQPGDLVAIMTTGGGAGIFQQFTNDRRQLYASIDRVVWSPWFVNPVNGDPVARTLETNVPGDRRGAISFRADAIAGQLLGTLNYAIYGLAELPGRKAITLFSDGFQVVRRDAPLGALEALERTIEHANRSAVVIYSIDSRGLDAFNEFSPGGTTFFQHVAQYESNDMLAKGTGGLSFHENNGLAGELQKSLDDMSGYYLVGFRPGQEYFEKVGGRAQFHNISVKVKRAGLHARSRLGFYGVPDAPPAPPGKTRHEELRAALLSPFRAGGIPVQLSAFYSPVAARDPKTKRRPALLETMLAIDARSLKFEDTPDGRKKIVLDAVTAAYGANSELVASSDKTFTVQMTEEEANRVMTTGLVYGMEMTISRPGPYQVRTALRDAASEKLGSATAFVQIPDFDQSSVALTSVRLTDRDAGRNEELERHGIIGAGSEATRVFEPGAELDYSFNVYGARREKGSGGQQVDLEVRLFRGPEKFFDGQQIRLERSGESGLPAAGHIKLPADIPPGDYAAEMVVYDRLAGSKQIPAAQWVDFSIAR